MNKLNMVPYTQLTSNQYFVELYVFNNNFFSNLTNTTILKHIACIILLLDVAYVKKIAHTKILRFLTKYPFFHSVLLSNIPMWYRKDLLLNYLIAKEVHYKAKLKNNLRYGLEIPYTRNIGPLNLCYRRP